MQVFDTIIEPAVRHLSVEDQLGDISQEGFSEELKKVLENICRGLQDNPVIVAHSENHFDGSGITRLLSNTAELDKVFLLSLHTSSFSLFSERLSF